MPTVYACQCAWRLLQQRNKKYSIDKYYCSIDVIIIFIAHKYLSRQDVCDTSINISTLNCMQYKYNSTRPIHLVHYLKQKQISSPPNKKVISVVYKVYSDLSLYNVEGYFFIFFIFIF